MCFMFQLTSRTLLALSLFLTTMTTVSPPARCESPGAQQTSATDAPGGAATKPGTGNATSNTNPGGAKNDAAAGGASKNATNGNTADAAADTAKKKGKRRHHGDTADGSEPRDDQWNSFHKPHTDVGGHKNTDSGFDFQHANEKL